MHLLSGTIRSFNCDLCLAERPYGTFYSKDSMWNEIGCQLKHKEQKWKETFGWTYLKMTEKASIEMLICLPQLFWDGIDEYYLKVIDWLFNWDEKILQNPSVTCKRYWRKIYQPV